MIFNHRREILLLKRGENSKNEAGYWNKVGGAVEYGEKSIEAMKREVKEEIGVTVKIEGMFPHSDHIIRKDNQHWLGLNYFGKIQKGEPKNMEPDKFDDMQWFSLKKLPGKISPPTRESIRHFLAGRYIKF